MTNSKLGHSRKKKQGLRCIRCIRAKKGPCVGGKPACEHCRSKNLLCVWEDEKGDKAEADEDDDGLSFIVPEKPIKITLSIRPSGVEKQTGDTIHLEPGPSAPKHKLDDDSTYGSEEPAPKRKRGRPPKNNTLTCLLPENVRAGNATPVAVEEPPTKCNRIQRMTAPKRKKLIHTEVVKYEVERYTTLIDDNPPSLPTYMDSRPLNNDPRYPSPSADYAQAPRFFQLEEPWTLYFPRIYIDTVEVSIGPFEDDQDEWRRLAPEDDGGRMAYPSGRWIQEGPGTFRWVK